MPSSAGHLMVAPSMRSSTSTFTLRKRRSRQKLHHQRSKRQLRPQQSTLDMLDNHNLTTFPQVYQLNLDLDHPSLPFSQSSTIVFVEDYFDNHSQPHIDFSNDFSNTFDFDPPIPNQSKVTTTPLSPFSTMRRGSVVKTCVHCHKQLYEFSNTHFIELVCKDCACIHQSSKSKLRFTPSITQLRAQFMSTTSIPRTSKHPWYTSVRRILRWRWRLKGLLPSSIFN